MTSAFQREESLIRRKQEQWAKEKAEEAEIIGWFPFGAPGGGSPNRKFESKTPAPVATDVFRPRRESKLAKKLDRIEEAVATSSKYGQDKMDQSTHSLSGTDQQHSAPTTSQQYVYPGLYPHMMPYQVPITYGPYSLTAEQGPSPQNDQLPQQQQTTPPGWPPYPYAYPPQYTMIPPGAIPISTHTSEGQPVCPVSIAEQLAVAHGTNIWGMPMPNGPPGVRMGIPIPPPIPIHSSMIGSISSESGVSGVSAHRTDAVDVEKTTAMTRSMHVDEANEQTNSSRYDTSTSLSHDISLPMSNRPTGRSSRITRSDSFATSVYDEQIAEKRRIEAQKAEEDRLEEQRAARERADSERRKYEEEEHRRALEAERQKEEARRAEMFVDAVEKAKKEAELLKKARLYKHVLAGAEKSPDLPKLERRLLGVDEQTGERLLKEVSHYERQKRLEWEEIERNAPPKKKKDGEEGKARSMSFGSRSRANSSKIVMDEENEMERSWTERTAVEPEMRSHETPANHSAVYSDDRPIRPQKDVDTSRTHWENRSMRESPRPALTSTPILRNGFGRASVRVTRGERRQKENSPVLIEQSTSPVQPMPSSIPVPQKRTIFPVENNDEPNRFAPLGLRSPDSAPSWQSYHKIVSTPIRNISSRRESNIDVSSALYGQIPTRSRRMRPTTNSPLDKMRGSVDSEETSSGTVSPDNNNHSPIPSSTENVQPQMDVDNEIKEYKTRSRSALGSPSFYLNGGRQSPLSASIFARKLEQKGCMQHEEDVLSPEARRKAEASLSRSPSMASLRGSLANLNLRGSMQNLSLADREASPLLNKFQSMTSSSRASLNLKKTAEKQKEIVERLNNLRSTLRSSPNYSSTRTPLRHSRPPPVITHSPAL